MGEEAPLRASPRCDWRRARGVVPLVFGVKPAALPVLIEGVVGRFLYADAGIMGGPIMPGPPGVKLLAAAAITSLWSEGSGGGDAARERMLLELPGRLGARSSFEYLRLGEAGGDKAFSTTPEVTVPDQRGLRANKSLSIWSAETMVCVPPSVIGAREPLVTALELRGASGVRSVWTDTGFSA
jgi:hypothetical protein